MLFITASMLSELIFLLTNRMSPRGGMGMPPWFTLPMAAFALVTAIRIRRYEGLARGLFGLSVVATTITPLKSAGWSPWVGRMFCQMLYISFWLWVGLPRSARARWLGFAVVILSTKFFFSIRSWGYHIWMRSNGLESVMSP